MRSAGGSEWADEDAVASLPEQSAVYSGDIEVRRAEVELPLCEVKYAASFGRDRSRARSMMRRAVVIHLDSLSLSLMDRFD